MLARTSYILVILRVCGGERRMAGESQNSSGRGGVTLGYMGVQTTLLEPPRQIPRVPKDGPRRLPALQGSHPGLALQLASCCSVTPLSALAKKAVFGFTQSLSARCRDITGSGRLGSKRQGQITGLGSPTCWTLPGTKEEIFTYLDSLHQGSQLDLSVCVCIYMCMCMCVYLYVCACVYVCIHICVCLCVCGVCTYMCICMCVYVCVVCVYTCVCTYVYVCVYVCVYMCVVYMCVCVCVCVHIGFPGGSVVKSLPVNAEDIG